MNKCNYCEKEIEYYLDAIMTNNTVEVRTCADHLGVGRAKQQNALHEERMINNICLLKK